MFIQQLFEGEIKRVIVIYPGRFQPFHLGHKEVFETLQAKFGMDNVFIGTSNKTDAVKSPFNFSDKLQLMTAAGVNNHHVIEVSSPYMPDDYVRTIGFDPKETVMIFAVGEPDLKRLEVDANYTALTPTGRPSKIPDGKSVGDPKPFKTFRSLQDSTTADQHQYVLIVNEREKAVEVNGKKINASHGTQVRELWNQVRNDPKASAQVLQQLYGRSTPELAHLFNKIPDSNAAPAPAPAAAPKLKAVKQPKPAADLNEFAPPGGDDGNDGFSDETLKRLAAQWWQGDEDPRVEKTLAAAGWEIGQDEGYDNGGVFVVQAGDINGDSYISWPAEELEGLGEGAIITKDQLVDIYIKGKGKNNMPIQKKVGAQIPNSKVNAFISAVANKYGLNPKAFVYGPSNPMSEDAAGVGVVASKKQKNDPRYSMSLTKDVRPGEVTRNMKKLHLEGNRGYNHGFASPTAPSLGGSRRREDDEYHVPDPAPSTWYIRANGKIIKDKMGTPYQYRDKETARKAAMTMMTKPFNAGKKFVLTTRPEDEAPAPVAEASGPVTHRIGLTVTDPNHPMVSKRGETYHKTVRITQDVSDREAAINQAIAHYRRKGYKVHDHHYIGTVDNEPVAEATGDKPFDKMMTKIKQGTNKQKTADRKEQQKQSQQRARDAFGNMFGGGNPADKLSIRKGVAEGATGAKPGWMLRQDPALAKKVKDSKAGHQALKKWAGKPVPKDNKQDVAEGSINEFAPASNPGGGNYLKALASAWYNGTFNTGDLHKGIKSQEDVERILERGIHCGDGKVRKYIIGYNAAFDGVEIQSHDHYEYADYDDAGREIDSRTGRPWGPYDVVEFHDRDLDESVAEGGIATVGWPDEGNHTGNTPPVSVGGTFPARPVVKKGSLVKAIGISGVYRVMDIRGDQAYIVQEIPNSGGSNYVPMSDLRVWTNKPIMKENAEELNIGDPVIITGKGIEFEGKTGDIDSFGAMKRFVVVDLYNHGKHSFHSSDVSYNDHADKEDDLDEDMYQYNREDPYNSEFAPRAGMGRMTLRGWKQQMIKRTAELAQQMSAAGQDIDKSALWDNVHAKLKSMNMDPIAQEIEQAQAELEKIRQRGGVRSRAFNK
jgi:hypothetical protein